MKKKIEARIFLKYTKTPKVYEKVGFQVALVVKNLPTKSEDIGDAGSIPSSGRCPGIGNDNPLQ